MTAYDRWLEQPYQDKYEHEDAIDNKQDELLESTFNPHDVDVFLLALNEGCMAEQYIGKKMRQDLQEAIALGRSGFDAIGKIVWACVYDFCQDAALEEAKKIIQKGN